MWIVCFISGFFWFAVLANNVKSSGGVGGVGAAAPPPMMLEKVVIQLGAKNLKSSWPLHAPSKKQRVHKVHGNDIRVAVRDPDKRGSPLGFPYKPTTRGPESLKVLSFTRPRPNNETRALRWQTLHFLVVGFVF